MPHLDILGAYEADEQYLREKYCNKQLKPMPEPKQEPIPPAKTKSEEEAEALWNGLRARLPRYEKTQAQSILVMMMIIEHKSGRNKALQTMSPQMFTALRIKAEKELNR